jgi:hypothetical protein
MENKQTEEKLTAMEHLINWIDSDCTPMDCVMKAKELLQMEKEQIKDAWEDGFMSSAEGWNGEIPPECYNEVLDTEQYYNKTYGKI